MTAMAVVVIVLGILAIGAVISAAIWGAGAILRGVIWVVTVVLQGVASLIGLAVGWSVRGVRVLTGRRR